MTTTPHLSLIPIVVAVTGHRDVPDDDVPVLAAAVTEQLRKLSASYPNSPCMLLSGLAEGADRIAARCALEGGWQLGVALPLPPQDYESDFVQAASRDEFRSLLAKAEWWQDISASRIGRPDCYHALGDWMATQSHALLALWDGKPGRGPGGTADVVHRFIEGSIEEKRQLVAPDTNPVIHVQTRRTGTPDADQTFSVGSVLLLPPHPLGFPHAIDLECWRAALTRIDQFNADVLKADQAGLFEDRGQSAGLPQPENGVPANRLPLSPRSLFHVSEALAMQAQRERTRLFKGLLLLAAGAVLLAQTYSSLFTLPGLLWSAIGLSCAGVGWYRVSENRHVEQRYLDYRALAEACKVQYFWQMAGLDDKVINYYLRDQAGELEWIRLALRCTTMLDTDNAHRSPHGDRLKWVRDNWLEDQRRYFMGDPPGRTGKASVNHRLDEMWSRRSRGLALSGACLMVVAATFHLFVADLSVSSHDWLLRCLMVSYSVVFGAAALCKVYQETSAFSDHARTYERMGRTLQIALVQLDEALELNDECTAVEIIRSYGVEALKENGDWLQLHRERPVSAQGFG